MALTGELLLATTGILVALEPGPVKVTKKQLIAASKLPDRARRRLGEWLEADKPKAGGAPPALDYERLLELLPPPVTEDRLRENVAGWPDQALANEYAAALGRAWGYLQAEFPIKVREHLTGPENVRPSELTLARFRRVLELVEDPLRVIDRLEEGALLAAEVTTLADAYPALLEMLREQSTDALIEETARRRAGDKEWHIPRRKELMLRRLLELPKGSIDQRTGSAIRKLYDKNREDAQQPAERPMPNGKPPGSDAEMTRNQRVDSK